MKIARNPENIHPPVAPYVHQIEVTGPHRWLTLSGQIGMMADGTIPEDAAVQLNVALENIKKFRKRQYGGSRSDEDRFLFGRRNGCKSTTANHP